MATNIIKDGCFQWKKLKIIKTIKKVSFENLIIDLPNIRPVNMKMTHFRSGNLYSFNYEIEEARDSIQSYIDCNP